MPDPSQSGYVPTVSEVISTYLRHAVLADSTRERWTRDLDDFVRELGDKPISLCRAADLTFWVDSHPGWKSPATKATAITAVRTAFKWWVDHELIARSPFARVQPPWSEVEPRRSLTDEEFAALVAGSSDRFFRWVLRFIRYTGARTNEVRTLRRNEVHLDLGVAIQVRHKTRRKQRTPKSRLIPLEDRRAIAVVEEVLASGIDSEFLFVNRRHDPWTRYSLSCRMKRLKKKLGLPADAFLYGARHQAANDWLHKGAGLRFVSQLLGHSSTAITEKWYLDPQDLEATRRELRRILGQV